MAANSMAVRNANSARVPVEDLKQAAALALLTKKRPEGKGYAYQMAQWAMLEELRREARQARPIPMPETVEHIGPDRWLEAAQALHALVSGLSPALMRVIVAIVQYRTPRDACRAIGVTQGMASIARRQARHALEVW